MGTPSNQRHRDLLFLAATIWGEARGETLSGQRAVAEVIMNRLATGRWGRTVEHVVTAPWQFSVWNKNDPNYKHMMDFVTIKKRIPAMQLSVASLALSGRMARRLPSDTLHYYNPRGVRQTPNWVSTGREPIIIGRHHFIPGVR